MKATAKSVMTKDLITIPAGSPISEAWKILQDKKFRHLPVTGDAGSIIGIISQRDTNSLKSPGGIPIEYVMSSPVITMNQNAPLRSAIFKMLEKKISSLLIVDEEDNAVGIVTTDDLLWYLAYLLTDAKESGFSFASLFDLQTVGEAARQIANAGI